jgi:putative oxidoreductase
MDLALLVLRIVVGGLFVGHGAQKLFGLFGGHGLAGTAGFFDQLGLRPGALHARAAGAAEFFGGALLALGLFTPFAAAALIATMTAAIITVHYSKGVWSTEGGYEYNLVLIAAVFALAGAGPGAWSLDNAFSLDLSGTGWALGALAIGVFGGLGAVISGRTADRTATHHPPSGGVPA